MTQHERRCSECGEIQSAQRRAIDYPESGLNNVQLNNVPVWVCSNGHEEVEIPAVSTLHGLLTELVLRKPAPLSSTELRFLRKRAGLTGRALARRIGLSPEYLSNVENGHATPERKTELLIRLAVAAILAAQNNEPFPADLAGVVDELDALDVGTHRVRHVDEATADHEWEADPV